MALNEEATQDSTSISHEALAVTEKPNVILTTQTSAQLTVMKDTGSLRRLRVFFSGSAHDSRCGQKHVIKAVESFFLQALRTLALTIDKVVRFDNKIHDVRSKCDHEELGAEIRDCWLHRRGEEGVTWPNLVASKCTNFHHSHRSMDGCASNQVQKGHSRYIHEVACPALCTRQSDSFQSRDSTNPPLSAHGSLGHSPVCFST